MTKIKAWAARGPKEKLVRYEYNPGQIKPDEVEIAVMYSGLCHSDLSNLNNDWGMAKYPLIPGHEVIGKIVALGKHVKGLKKGQIVGVGWNSESCMFCRKCISGIDILPFLKKGDSYGVQLKTN